MRLALAAIATVLSCAAAAQEAPSLPKPPVAEMMRAAGDSIGNCPTPPNTSYRTFTKSSTTSATDAYVEAPGTLIKLRTKAAGCATITFTAETDAHEAMFIAAFVDGKMALPGPVYFRLFNALLTAGEARSFTFIVPELSAGRHEIKIGFASTTGEVRLGYRTIVVQHP